MIDRKKTTQSMILTSVFLGGTIMCVIFGIVAAKILDYVPQDFLRNIKNVFTFSFYHTDIVSAAVLIYFVVIIAIALWIINLIILILNWQKIGDNNMLLIAFIFAFFFIFPIAFLFYTIVDLVFIKQQITNKQIEPYAEIIIPESATFSHKNYLDVFSLKEQKHFDKEKEKEKEKES